MAVSKTAGRGSIPWSPSRPGGRRRAGPGQLRQTNRHRLDRGDNRQLNTTIHRIVLTRARCHPETQNYIARKRAEGKTGLEAMRCLKRHLTRRIWHLLQPPHPTRNDAPTKTFLT